MRPSRTPSSSEVLVSNISPLMKEGPDSNFGGAGWNRVPSSHLVKSYRGYTATIYEAPLGYTWTLSAPIAGSDMGQMGMRYASPSLRQV
jgi:hypothetical protein